MPRGRYVALKWSRIQFSSWTEIGGSSWWVCEIRNCTKCQFWPLYKQIVSLQWHNDIIYELGVKITRLYFLDILGINLYRCRFLVLWAKNKQTNLGMHYTRSVLWEQIIPLASYFNWLISWSWTMTHGHGHGHGHGGSGGSQVPQLYCTKVEVGDPD